jgi:hypothetical protein
MRQSMEEVSQSDSHSPYHRVYIVLNALQQLGSFSPRIQPYVLYISLAYYPFDDLNHSFEHSIVQFHVNNLLEASPFEIVDSRAFEQILSIFYNIKQ